MKSLDDVLSDAWGLLNEGVTDRRSPFHLAKLATVTENGRPAQRTVILRHADSGLRQVRFHTDRRSGKAADIAINPAVALLLYDPARQVQLRLDGEAAIHADDDVARAAWAASREPSRACYLAAQAPGTRVDAPPPAPRYDTAVDESAFANFCAVVVTVGRFEWMHLAADGHQRACFDWTADADMTASWLAP